jgi:hypothetical protein
VKPYNRRLDEEIAEELIADYDLILEGSDNFETRYLVNKIAVAQQKPMVSGALSQWEGQISVFDPARKGPCYQCIFPEKPADGLAPSCAEAGVFAPLPGVIGTMMAGEAMKLILKTGATLTGSMLIYDAHFGETRQIRLNKRTDCPICSGTNITHRKARSMTNPLLDVWDTPFQVPPFAKITAADFAPALDIAMQDDLAKIDAIAQNPEPRHSPIPLKHWKQPVN